MLDTTARWSASASAHDGPSPASLSASPRTAGERTSGSAATYFAKLESTSRLGCTGSDEARSSAITCLRTRSSGAACGATPTACSSNRSRSVERLRESRAVRSASVSGTTGGCPGFAGAGAVSSAFLHSCGVSAGSKVAYVRCMSEQTCSVAGRSVSLSLASAIAPATSSTNLLRLSFGSSESSPDLVASPTVVHFLMKPWFFLSDESSPLRSASFGRTQSTFS